MSQQTEQEMMAALAAPFDRKAVKFRPGATTKDKKKAMALAYVDVRAVMDRLDEVLGCHNWQDSYRFAEDNKTCICTLQVRINGDWIEKVDVGSQSENLEDEGDRRKSAVSDALKRTAVKWGVGRYLHKLPSMWVDYDATTKRLVNLPDMPLPIAAKPALMKAAR